MPCGCGGKKAGSKGPTQYRVTYPNGRTQTYLQKHQADREGAKEGVTVETIER